MASEPIRFTEPVKLGEDFELDLRAYDLRRAGRALRLERIPMDLLVLLVERHGELVTRDQIIEKIWGRDVFLDTDGSINSAIRKIRQVLRDDPEHPRFVQTVSGRGYRFIAPVEEVGAPILQAAGSLTPPAENLLGKRISHYRVLQVLGGGGMGVVYKAEDLKLGRMVALKFLPSELASDPVAFERLQREGRAASALDHPNICSIYQLGEHEGQPFIVMQLLEGQTLREWIEAAAVQDTATRVANLAALAIQIADGLEAAHAKGIIHRDIKPANIFITTRAQAKILDFGVAKFVDTVDLLDAKSGAERANDEDGTPTTVDPRLTLTGVSVGTPSYLSPEQIRREQLDARTDLFSFGLVLYEMATGERAFSGHTAAVIRDSVLNLPAVPVRQLNPEIPAQLEGIIHRALEKDREPRYQSAADIRADLQCLRDDTESGRLAAAATTSAPPRPAARMRKWVIAAVVLAIVAAISVVVYRRRSHPALLSNSREPLFVSEFTNATGDPVFDSVLRDLVTTELGRSPVVEVVDDDRMSDLLRSVTNAPDAHLTPDLTRQVCRRGQGKLMMEGTIKPQGSAYVIELAALDCTSGRVQFRQQAESRNIDAVLSTLSRLAAATRLRLSGASANAPLDPAPLLTSSVQAYKAFLTGYSLALSQPIQAVAMMQRATQLDPNFAEAWVFLGMYHSSLGETQREVEDLQHAFALRDKMLGSEKQRIEAMYYLNVTGEIYKAIDALRSWERLEPNAFPPHKFLGQTYDDIGSYEKAADEFKQLMAVAPNQYLPYFSLALVLEAQGHYEQAAAMLQVAQDKKLQGPWLHAWLYELALLRSDPAGLQREQGWMASNAEDPMVVWTQARTDLLAGHLDKARQRTRQAVKMTLESDLKESAAQMLLNQATVEALTGEIDQARNTVSAATKLARSKDEKSQAAFVMALAGEELKARQIIDELALEYPSDTLLNAIDVPLVHAAFQLKRGHADQALRILEPVKPYELGFHACLLPMYVRATAYLQLRSGRKAAAEFQGVLDHRGVRPLASRWELSQLGLARAYAMQGDMTEARAAYLDFFTLWKDADPNIPILKQAKAEYAKVQ